MPLGFVPYLSVDPGRAMGWALYSSRGELVACGLTKGDAPVFPAGCLGLPVLVIEHPHGGQSKASKKNLVTLGRRMERAIIVARAGWVKTVEPIQWKGNEPKRAVHPDGTVTTPALDRIRRAMRPVEADVFARCGSGKHDVLDAIGIGQWWGEVRGYPFRVAA